MQKAYSFPGIALLGLFTASVTPAAAQFSITTANSPITQNFDALPSANGSSYPSAGGVFTEGWLFLEGGSNANATYSAGTGSGTTGDTYSFGIAGVNAGTDRAFGLLQSTNLTSIIGFKFINNTGQTITSLTVSYTGELWRLNSGGDLLAFSFQPGDAALNASSGWTNVPALDFTTPATGSAAAVDGNSTAYRTTVGPFTITGLSVLPGTTVTFRWVDATAGSSAGMGIDDFSIKLIPAATDYFRSAASGNWNSLSSWERSADGLNWSPATNAVPTSMAAGVVIQPGHTITTSANLTTGKLVIQPGGKLLWAGGSFTLSDSPGDDLVLQGTNSVFEIATANNPVISTGATIRVGAGAVLLLSGHGNVMNYQSTSWVYADGSVFEYTNGTAPLMTGVFFGSQDAGAVPVFRYNSPNTAALGSSGATTIDGKVEVSPGKTLNLSGVSGTLTIRNGITGAGQFTATTAYLTGSSAEIGGTGQLNSHVTIAAGCTTLLASDKTITAGKTILVNGTFDLSTRQLQTISGMASFSVGSSGLVKTANAAGLVNGTGSLKTGSFSVSFAPGATVDYNAAGNQVVTTAGVPAYQQLIVSGTGIKTAQGSANVTVQGSCLVKGGATLALSGNASENLYLNNNASLQIESGGSFDNGGESSVTTSGGVPAILISGTFITRDQQGFTGPNAAIPTIIPVLSPNCIVEYGRAGDQAVQATLTYENLVLSGSGTKTPASAISLTGTLAITGSVVLNGASHTIGGPGNHLVMSGSSRFVTGGTGARPAMDGTYTLGPSTTIEFTNSNSTTCTIRQGSPVIQYANIEITGSNVSTPNSGITLQSGGTVTVRSGGVLKLTSPNGLVAPINAAILSTNNPQIRLQTGSTVDYNGADQVLTSAYNYSHLVLSGSGNKTPSEPIIIEQSLTRAGSALLNGPSPVYAANASLLYADGSPGRSYTTGAEWPAVNPPTNITVNLTGNNSPTVLLSEDKSIDGTLTITAGSLHLNGKTLAVGGNLSGNGTLTGSAVSRLLINGGTSILSFTQTTDNSTNSLADLVIQSGTVTLGNKLAIYRSLEVSGGILNLAAKPLVLKSTASETARVAPTSGLLTGATNVSIERYIPAWSSRRYRLVTAPVTGTSINAAWQEGRTWDGGTQPAEAGTSFGTLITGQQQGSAATAAVNGFDFWPEIAGASGSVRRYSAAANTMQASWQPVSSTLDTKAFDELQAYLLYVRGDRSYANGTTAGATVLRATGTLRQGSQSIGVQENKTHTLVGNPYASPLDFAKVFAENSSRIQDLFWTWQAGYGSATGNYVLTLPDGSGNYETIPSPFLPTGSGNPGHGVIHSGQGFFVVPRTFDGNSSTVHTLQFQESHKSSGAPAASVFRQKDVAAAKLFINLRAKEGVDTVLLDGVLSCFYPAGTERRSAVQKAVNSGENLSIYTDDRDLIVASASMPKAGDQLLLRMWNTAERDYLLEIKWQNGTVPGLAAFLQDGYLKKEIPLSQQDAVTAYPFSLTADAASKDLFRFRLVFKPLTALPVSFINLSAREGAGGVTVEWTVADEAGISRYDVERKTSGAGYQVMGGFAVKGNAGKQRYGFPDRQPMPENAYRIKVTMDGGAVQYSPVVSCRWKGRGEGIGPVLNPVTGGGLALQFNRQPKGNYRCVLYTAGGQKVGEEAVSHGGSDAVHRFSFGRGLAGGGYFLVVTLPDKRKEVVRLVLLRPE